jgi:hypothetical protein
MQKNEAGPFPNTIDKDQLNKDLQPKTIEVLEEIIGDTVWWFLTKLNLLFHMTCQ